MTARSTDLVFLLGAGCSVEAQIPASAAMITRIETKLGSDPHWRQFESLYYHVKSSIYFSHGIKGPRAESQTYNIETLASTLYQLEQNEDHPLYPFIAAWNSRFIALASVSTDGVSSFSRVSEFRRRILDALQKWVNPIDLSASDYYSGFIKIKRELNFPLQIFSLNYDLCFERLERSSATLETGFATFGAAWDWRRFTGQIDLPEPDFYLYKLHGSVDWVRDQTNGSLTRAETPGSIEPANLEVIFGRDFKLEASDPYLFYAYQFRMRSLEARLIVSIGYGFDDVHINKMMSQAMLSDGQKVLAVVSYWLSDDDRQRLQNKILKALSLAQASGRVHILDGTAKNFLQDATAASKLIALLPQTEPSTF